MKGLLKKDMELLKINGRVFGIAVLVALVYSLTGKMGAQFIMVYLTIMSAFLVLNTVSYDEAEKGMTFLMTLPVLRDTYVKEKYIFAAGLAFAGWLISLILSAFSVLRMGGPESWGGWWSENLIYLALSLFMISFMLPIQIKFGTESGRIILAVILLCIFLLILGAVSLMDSWKIALERAFKGLEDMGTGAWIFMGILLTGVCWLLSCMISIGIMKKKEY